MNLMKKLLLGFSSVLVLLVIVNASIDEVSQLAKVSTDSAHEIAAVTEEQLASTEEVSNAATALANMAEELREVVGKFKL